MSLRFSLDFYDVELKNGEVIIIPKDIISYLTQEEMINTDYSHSVIENCLINGESVKNTYRSILIKIWELYGLDNITKNTSFSIIPEKLVTNKERGYHWNKKLQMSFRSESATKTMREIINICKLGEIKMDIHIRLKNGNLIHYITN
jgi:hypothetical protein